MPRNTGCKFCRCFSSPSLLLLLCASHASAQQPASGDLVKRLDPTDFRTRYETRHEYQSLQEGGFRNLLMPRLDYAFSKTFRMRIEAPFTSFSPTGDGAKLGFGDLTLGGAYRVARAQGYEFAKWGRTRSPSPVCCGTRFRCVLHSYKHNSKAGTDPKGQSAIV